MQYIFTFICHKTRQDEKAGAELGQAHLKLGLDFTLIFCRFGLSRIGLESSLWMNRKLVRLYLQSRPALIFCRFVLSRLGLVELIGQI